MKGIITGLKRMSVHDGAGLRTTIFFKGCSLKCIWCHNPETQAFVQEIGFYRHKCIGCGSCAAVCPTSSLSVNLDLDSSKCVHCHRCVDVCPTDARVLHGEQWESGTLVQHILADREFFRNSGGGVTLSGGECLCQIDFAQELASLFFHEGISVDVDTCGHVSFQAFDKIIPYTDEFLYDIKAIDPQVHKRCTGQDNHLILENLMKLDALGCRVEIRYPYVPGYNDGECRKIGAFLAQTKNIRKIKVLGYHSFARSKYAALGRKDTLPDMDVTQDTVQQAVEILRSYGLEAINGMVDD